MEKQSITVKSQLMTNEKEGLDNVIECIHCFPFISGIITFPLVYTYKRQPCFHSSIPTAVILGWASSNMVIIANLVWQM